MFVRKVNGRPARRRRRYRFRNRRWVLVLALLVAAVFGSASWPRKAHDAAIPPLHVTQESTEAGLRLTVHTAASAAAVTVNPDGRGLLLEVRGANARLADGIVGDEGFLRSYEVVAAGKNGFTLSVGLAAYGGHDLSVTESAVVLDLIRPALVARRIVVDPGHGGRDPGCVSPSGMLEAPLTLAVAEHLRQMLEAVGADVRLTRDIATDFDQYSGRTMSSSERAAKANEWRADVFVSIHFNSFTSPRYSGTEVWQRGDNPESLRLARLLVDELAELGLNRRGVKRGDFAVLREAKMPAVLVELGFLSNPGDEAFFQDPRNLHRAAELMLRALEEYFR